LLDNDLVAMPAEMDLRLFSERLAEEDTKNCDATSADTIRKRLKRKSGFLTKRGGTLSWAFIGNLP